MEFFKFFREAVPALKENNRFTLEDQKYWARIYLEEQTEAKRFPNGVAITVLSSGKYSMIRAGKNNNIYIKNNESGHARRMGYK